MLPPLRELLNRLRPPHLWWLGKPYRVTIISTASGTYLQVHHTQGTEWIELPARAGSRDRSDDRERAAAAAALGSRGLTWTLPWQLDSNGDLTAEATPLTRREDTR
jgi:hypothetical protein